MYQGDCHPLHHDCNYVLMLYCKRSDEEENNDFVHYLFAINNGLYQVRDPGKVLMNIMIKYFTLPISTATFLDAPNNWNCYASIQVIFHKNSIYLKKLVYGDLSILTPTQTLSWNLVTPDFSTVRNGSPQLVLPIKYTGARISRQTWYPWLPLSISFDCAKR